MFDNGDINLKYLCLDTDCRFCGLSILPNVNNSYAWMGTCQKPIQSLSNNFAAIYLQPSFSSCFGPPTALSSKTTALFLAAYGQSLTCSSIPNPTAFAMLTNMGQFESFQHPLTCAITSATNPSFAVTATPAAAPGTADYKVYAYCMPGQCQDQACALTFNFSSTTAPTTWCAFRKGMPFLTR